MSERRGQPPDDVSSAPESGTVREDTIPDEERSRQRPQHRAAHAEVRKSRKAGQQVPSSEDKIGWCE